MGRSLAALALATAGCVFSGASGSSDTDANPGDDAPPGGDAACNPLGFDPSNVDPCALPASSGPLDLDDTDATLDTGDPGAFAQLALDADTRDQTSGGSQVLVVVVDRLSLINGAELEVRGPVPLVLVVLGNVAINGSTLRAGADGATPGPGAGDAACGVGTGGATQASDVTGTPSMAGSGGGGGGFATAGAQGASVPDAMMPIAGGVANPVTALAPLRGGCPGGPGGDSMAGVLGGAGGAGGGALQLVVAGTLSVGAGGVITAGGGGGLGATGAYAGGGGGGSGGALLLEARTVSVGAGGYVIANGGAGGEGTANQPAGGVAGEGGDTAFDISAVGGDGSSGRGGGGGGGGYAATAPVAGTEGTADTRSAGSGGGGGSVGTIVIRSVSSAPMLAGTVSPDPLN